MKLSARLALFVVAVLFAAVEMRAQDTTAVRPRVVATATQQQQQPVAPAVPQPNPAVVGPTLPVMNPVINVDKQKPASAPITNLTPALISSRIAEPQRMFKTRPKPTAMVPSIEFVTIAALDKDTAR